MVIYLNLSTNYLSNNNCNYMVSFDYHDNPLKRMKILQLKNFSCIEIRKI